MRMMGGGFTGLGTFFGLITWLAIMSYFILGSIYFWKEIKKK